VTFTYLDAECRLDPSTWDGESYDQIAEAQEGCRRCPALDACATWAKGRTDLVGIVAGKPRDPATADRARRGRHDTHDRTIEEARLARADAWAPTYPVRPVNCGTEGGYGVHRKRGEHPCDECRAAKNAAQRERDRKRAAAKKEATA